MSVGADSRKVILIALMANLGIALAKFVGALISGSASLMAEAVHSFVDCTNQVLLLIGKARSQRPATAAHPLGFGREAYFSAFIVAILLFSLGGLFAIYEGIHKYSSREGISSPWLSLGILMVSLVLEGFSLRACLHEVNAHNPFGSLWQWFKRTTSADLLVILTEDIAAMMGLTVATVCLLITWYTQDPRWDAIGSISVGIVLVVVAVLLAVEIKSLIIGEPPNEDLSGDFVDILKLHLPHAKVLNFLALQTGPDQAVVAVKVHPGPENDLARAIELINLVEKDFKAKHSVVKWQFVEFDYYD